MPHGEGRDGSTQPAEEARAGHAGSGKHEPTSLRAIATRASVRKHRRFRDLYQEANAELSMHYPRDLNKDSASGVEGLTVEQYARNLEENLVDLAERAKVKRNRAKLVRMRENRSSGIVPGAPGNRRPCGGGGVVERARNRPKR